MRLLTSIYSQVSIIYIPYPQQSLQLFSQLGLVRTQNHNYRASDDWFGLFV